MAEYNVTVTRLSETGLYIPLENYLVMSMLAVTLAVFVVMFLYGTVQLGKRLDRYRLKYGFDNEIESKDITSKDIAGRLEKRQKAFNRRTLKD